jgi:ribonuclease HI
MEMTICQESDSVNKQTAPQSSETPLSDNKRTYLECSASRVSPCGGGWAHLAPGLDYPPVTSIGPQDSRSMDHGQTCTLTQPAPVNSTINGSESSHEVSDALINPPLMPSSPMGPSDPSLWLEQGYYTAPSEDPAVRRGSPGFPTCPATPHPLLLAEGADPWTVNMSVTSTRDTPPAQATAETLAILGFQAASPSPVTSSSQAGSYNSEQRPDDVALRLSHLDSGRLPITQQPSVTIGSPDSLSSRASSTDTDLPDATISPLLLEHVPEPGKKEYDIIGRVHIGSRDASYDYAQSMRPYEEMHTGTIPCYLAYWTDGSIQEHPKSPSKSSAAVAIRKRQKLGTEMAWHYRSWLVEGLESIEKVELLAMGEALRMAQRDVQRHLVIAAEEGVELPAVIVFTDCKHALYRINRHTLDALPSSDPALRKVFTACAVLAGMGVRVDLRWCPAHVGIEGNEIADMAAREARLNLRRLTVRKWRQYTCLGRVSIANFRNVRLSGSVRVGTEINELQEKVERMSRKKKCFSRF